MKFIISIFLLFNLTAFAEDWCNKYYIFDTQQGLDTYFQTRTESDTIDGCVDISFDTDEDRIVDLSHFSNITTIEGDLIIRGYANGNINNFEEFGNLETINGNLNVSVDGFKNFTGFEKLKKIDGDLIISYTDMINLKGLEALETVTGNIEINHTSVKSLQGLESLVSVGRYMNISVNDSLTDISYLNDNLWFTQEFPGLYITGNHNLSICNNPLICKIIERNNTESDPSKIVELDFVVNSPGCNSMLEVQDNCILPVEESVEQSTPYTFLSDKLIKLNPKQLNTAVAIYNILGEEFTDNLRIKDYIVDLSALGEGFYILVLGTESLKIFIR